MTETISRPIPQKRDNDDKLSQPNPDKPVVVKRKSRIVEEITNYKHQITKSMKNKLPLKDIQIAGYFAGAIGKITELHATYYSDQWGFDVSFETQVGRELSEFMSRFQETRDGLWTCLVNQHFAGSAAIDGQLAESEGARLRWFIVAPEFQDSGIGSVLLDRAVGFCRQVEYKSVFLWTFKGLDAARLLYERLGFRLAEDHLADQWGNHITEQRFELTL